jgi:ABC-type polar amino acid transport system ATPase subunit
MIRISGLCKAFAGAPVLSGVDASVEDGKIVALLGASGSGKSTLLRCLNGLETFDSGTLEVAGFELQPGAHDARLLQALRGKVGMVFQEFHLFSHLSVLDNVTLAPRVARGTPRSQAEAHARELLAQVGLADRADAMPRQLSGGQKQRVAIARALAQGVRVLLLDEPTSALDPELREEVREVLRQVARGTHDAAGSGLTILLVTHEHALAHELADEIWTLEAGKIAHKTQRDLR